MPWVHALRYLLLTPMCNSLPLSFSHNDGNTRFSIIAVFMGSFAPTAMYYDCGGWDGFMIVSPLSPSLFSSSTETIDSWSCCHHHSPMLCSDCTKFIMTGTPKVLIVSSSWSWPPPVAICPHAAARLHSHQWYPLRSFYFLGCFQGDGVVTVWALSWNSWCRAIPLFAC